MRNSLEPSPPAFFVSAQAKPNWAERLGSSCWHSPCCYCRYSIMQYCSYGHIIFYYKDFQVLISKIVFSWLTLFLPAKGGISPYMSIKWPSLVGIGLNVFTGTIKYKILWVFAKTWTAIVWSRLLFTLKQILFVKMIIVCLEFELGKQSGVFRLCGSLNDSDHVYHLQETTALL